MGYYDKGPLKPLFSMISQLLEEEAPELDDSVNASIAFVNASPLLKSGRSLSEMVEKLKKTSIGGGDCIKQIKAISQELSEEVKKYCSELGIGQEMMYVLDSITDELDVCGEYVKVFIQFFKKVGDALSSQINAYGVQGVCKVGKEKFTHISGISIGV